MQGSSKSPFPIRKHHLEPIVGDDECSYSEVVSVSSSGIFSAKDALSVSSSGMKSCKEYAAAATATTTTSSRDAANYGRKDHRDDEKYISSPESSDRMAQSVEESTLDHCVTRNCPNEENRDKQASSDDQHNHKAKKTAYNEKQRPECGSGHVENETVSARTLATIWLLGTSYVSFPRSSCSTPFQ
jgi:hypothetical protein